MVKTYKHLYPKIYDFTNLYRAHRQARRGGKRTQPEVAAFGPSLPTAPSPRPGGSEHYIMREQRPIHRA